MANTVALALQQTVVADWLEFDRGSIPVPPVGPVVWSLSDPTVGTVVVAADTFSATFTPSKAGTVTLTGVGDGFTAIGLITVTDVAVSAAISFEAPTP